MPYTHTALASVAALAMTSAVGAQAHDTCGDSFVVPTLPFSGSFNNALNTSNGAAGSCNSATATTMDNSLWLTFVVPEDGTYRVTVNASAGPQEFGPVGTLSVGICGALDELSCDDRAVPIVMEAFFAAGDDAFIAVGDWGTIDGGGDFSVLIELIDPCPTDTNDDGVTDLTDLLTVLANFGNPGTQQDGDNTGDGVVQLDDLLAVLAEFGNPCP